MDKPTIKRVKRSKKQVTTSEKILTGLGVGAALFGVSGSVANSGQPDPAGFVRVQQAKAAGLDDAEVEAATDTGAAASANSTANDNLTNSTDAALSADQTLPTDSELETATEDGSSGEAADAVAPSADAEVENADPATVGTISQFQAAVNDPQAVELTNTESDVEAAADTATDNTQQANGSQEVYTVKKGDTLWDLAIKYYGDGTKWYKILEANPDCVSKPGNARTLRIGAVLNIPNLQ